MKQKSAIIIGAGNRGNTYASYSISFPDEIKIVGVADPNPEKRDKFSQLYHLTDSQCYDSWESILNQPKLSDIAIITTQDQMHIKPALAAMKKGYHILLEKPLATTEEDCITFNNKAKDYDRIIGLCHVLRFTSHYIKIKELINSGVIGDIVNIEHLEPVNYWHMAHSYVRGNWRRLDESSPMIVAKSIHDIDLVSWFANSPYKSIYSTGSLRHFTKENAPEGSTDRCISNCAVENECPYSALKLYMNMELTGWPVSVISSDLSKEGREKALQEGPYGRCVYQSDNDVVDHQVVSIEFENDVKASFTMSAFTDGERRTRIMGTMGEIIGDFNTITLNNFRNQTKEIVWAKSEEDEMGHGGGDFGLMKQFLVAVRANDPTLFSSSLEAAVESHLMSFGAEKSRLEKKVVHPLN
ncbi:MAG: Gfo/Idh/MocA family oxidoreductase [Candidatus Marinimicrobia bacterium]|jgi:predicted dehydrogenase|nr:Gfo/Idh/MocA family oxidoreductase [Candidatus Neomarinimicrobiota bacterium]MBT3500741.1 Gfo/Idh/MocA family oxidoreductase [Candidatus Neomarinimicrobiota bacterium]MBT3838688.1 Gfo/Idh/MocA family oxidoreductase [Candidatus Neomarinimicrobiota bacterium]MBT3998374.1 Gfo/Idh/MocA family oxidoreductase [Candidatus Neomarinimicrobiota bacterium]MBT4283614.1 Gfo/Idh/MocA family oxidoreductase [Candidatus Neomarinimicrobiota bacterium]